MSEEKIAVCSCGSPLVWTFLYRGSEWYCVDCGHSYPMLNADRIESTPELEATQKINDEWFTSIYKDIVPSGAVREDCDKCGPDSSHWHHMPKEEKKKDSDARKKLDERINKNKEGKQDDNDT